MEQAAPLLNGEGSARDCTTLNDGDLNKSETLPKYQTRWERFKSRALVLSNLYTLLPLYLQPGGRQALSQRKIHPTAYLDALRGYAAFIVFLYHFWNRPTLWLIKLPIIRTFFLGGPGMVAVFFVISGYVLSYRILRMMRNKESAQLIDALSSSMFRRWLRLYGSTAVATFIAAFGLYFGWFLPEQNLLQNNFLSQMWHWFIVTITFSNPFANIEGWTHAGVFFTPYLPQMWTIPIEYRGSVLLFCFCLASAKMSVRSRMIFLWVVVLLSYYWRCVYVPEFLYGMFIAELSFCRHPERLGRPVLRTEENEKPRSERQNLWRLSQAIASPIGSCVALVVGVLLLGQPDPPDLGQSGPFPFQYLVRFIPFWYGEAAYTFWLSFGAFLVVLALDSSPMLQKPFTWSFSQYMGDLSFGIYAMHILWLEVFYKRVILYWQAVYLGVSYAAYIPGILIVTIFVLWSADYFRRLDRLVVQGARWLQMKVFTKWE